MILWGDGHWTTAPTARALLTAIGQYQHPVASARTVRKLLIHRYWQLTGVRLSPPRRAGAFLSFMAHKGMFRLYVA